MESIFRSYKRIRSGFADNAGGYIQTEWLYQSNNPNKRCMIKIQINSIELRSSVETALYAKIKLTQFG